MGKITGETARRYNGRNNLSISTGLKNPKKAKVKLVPKQQYRSNLIAVIKEIKKLDMSKEQKQYLKDFCPFWELINVILEDKITEQTSKKSDKDIRNIVRCFNKETKSFHLGGRELTITRDDIVKIFGISGGTKQIIVDGDKCADTDFYINNFNGVSRLTTTTLSRKLEAATSNKKTIDWGDICRLITLHMLSALFISTKGSVFAWGYNKYIMSLEDMKNYDWASHIFDKLHTSLCTYEKPEDVTGCVMALPYWIMEKFERSSTADDKASLVCQKWDLRYMASLTKKVAIISVIESKLEVTTPVQRKRTDRPMRGQWGPKKQNKLEVSQNPEETENCKKMKIEVDNSSTSSIDWSPQAMKSPTQVVALSISQENLEVNKYGSSAQRIEAANLNSPHDEDVKPSQVIIVDGTDITLEIPEDTRISYFSLCRTQNTPPHSGLTEGIPIKRAVSIIYEIVDLASAIKACNMSTPQKDIVYWGKALDSYSRLGMEVGFMQARVHKLLNIKTKAEMAMDKKREEDAKAAGEGFEEKIREFELEIGQMIEKIGYLELEIEKTREKKKKVDEERDGISSKAEEFKAMLKLEANAPW